MNVDVIIPTYKPDETFCLLLHMLQGQTFVVHRVIILNTEEPLWNQAVQAYPLLQSLEELPCSYTIHHLAKEAFDHGQTRMTGAEISKADFIIYMTQDAVPADEFMVEELIKPLQEKKAVVSYARQLPAKDCGIVEAYTRQFNYPASSSYKTSQDIARLGIKAFFCSDVCAAYDREAFFSLGGFEVPAIFNEDMFFAAKVIKAGGCVAYVAEAQVVHSHNYTAGQQFHRNFDLAVSQKQHPKIFEGIVSEKEGMRLVKSTVSYLFKIKKPYLIFGFFATCVGKYAGYFMGKRYEKLSHKKILRYTMNPGYWEKLWKEQH